MPSTESTDPKVPVEKPDREAAERPSEGTAERPGFSLGGAKDEDEIDAGGDLPEGGPVADPALGAGRATGGSELTNAKGVKD